MKKQKVVPIVLTVTGIAGMIATTVTAVKATPKALLLIEERKETANSEELPLKDIIEITWKCYAPSALIGITTIVCIASIHILDKRFQASLTTAYSVLSETYRRYRNAVIDTYGEDADTKIQAEIARNAYVSCGGLAIYSSELDSSEKVLFYDFHSKRYFESTMAAVLNAEYHVNRNLQLRGYVPLNEFYEFLGIAAVDYGDEIAWNMEEMATDGFIWLDFENKKATMDDGLECYIISSMYEPGKYIEE